LWQEGHTAHETEQEAIVEAKQMLEVYKVFAEEFMALPVLTGTKSPNERFAGAVETFCIEALMQDGKALQAGTSHFLGQNFAKAFDVKFLSKNNTQEYVWATSWGVTTRLIGALIMTHSDDNGLVLPPKVAPIQVVFVPIYKKQEELDAISEKMNAIKKTLIAKGISVKYDDRDSQKPGWKFNEYEFKGVPIRVAIGPRDMEEGTAEVVRRDTLDKQIIKLDELETYIPTLLDEIQQNLFKKALNHRETNTFKVDTWDEFQKKVEEGGFILAHWDGTSETEEAIKAATKATIRTIPLDFVEENGSCVFSGKPSKGRVIFAKAY
jgi:prolyl-tRNA synthetase